MMTPKGRNKKFYVLIKRTFKGSIETLHILHHNGTIVEQQLRDKGYYVLQVRQRAFYQMVKDKYKDEKEYWQKHKRYEKEYFYIKNEMSLNKWFHFVDVKCVEDNVERVKG